MKLYYILAFGTLLCSQLCSSASAAMASEEPYNSGIVIRWKDCKQRIDGFGIAQAGWAKELFAFKNREQVMDKMFGEDGLRLNILRGEIFPHYWENETDKDFNLNDDIHIELSDSDFINKSDDLLRRGQLWLTLKAKNKYHISKLVFSTWSAPAWMKSNGKVSNGRLKTECYTDFANYLAAFYNAYKSKGIAPYAISPSNEPGYAAPWNSSLWTADEMGKFITSYLGPTFRKENIPAKIIFGENPLWAVYMPQLKMVSSKDFTDTILQNYPEAKDFNLIAAGHGYSLSPDIMPIKVDKEYLKTAILPFEMAEKADLENVVPVVVTEFNEALTNAKEVYAKTNATQSEVDSAFDRLANVMHMLEFYKGDKSALQKQVDQINGLDESKYIESSWSDMLPALDKANDVLVDVNAMQGEVDEAFTELVKAFLNLRLKPNKDLLQELINKANNLNAANYSAKTWAVVADALNEAKAVLEDPEATQDQVDNAKDVLAKGLAGLVANEENINPVVKAGDTTVSIKTGDDSLIGVFAGLGLLSMATIVTSYKRKED